MNDVKRQPNTATGSAAGVVALVPPPSARRIRLTTLDDIAAELKRVYRDARGGRLDPQDGTRLAFILSTLGKAIEARTIEQRLTALEDRAHAQLR